MVRYASIFHYRIEDTEYDLTQLEENKYGKEGFKKLRANAKSREIPFTIRNADELVKFWNDSPEECHWCGYNIDEYHLLCNQITAYNGDSNLIHKLKKIILTNNTKFLTFDRRNSNGGYSIDNLVKACLICNIAKGFIINENEYSLIARRVIDGIRQEM